MARTNCRDCGAPIAWDKRDGRWIPIEPGTQDREGGAKRHICQLKQTCEDCGAEFQGASWMKICQKCYRAGANGGDGEGEDKAEKRPREPLKPGAPDDGNPF